MASEPFGERLYALIEARGMTVPGFAGVVDYPKQHLSNIRHGHRPAPLDRLEGWAEALKLSGMDREAFLDAGALTHCPERVQQLVLAIEDDRGAPLRSLLGPEGARPDSE